MKLLGFSSSKQQNRKKKKKKKKQQHTGLSEITHPGHSQRLGSRGSTLFFFVGPPFRFDLRSAAAPHHPKGHPKVAIRADAAGLLELSACSYEDGPGQDSRNWHEHAERSSPPPPPESDHSLLENRTLGPRSRARPTASGADQSSQRRNARRASWKAEALGGGEH